MNKDYTINITVEICDCEDEQEAINFVEDNIGLSEFNLGIEAKKVSDDEYQKLEWIHSQISELKDGVEVDLETMQYFIEDLREPYLEGKRSWIKIITKR